MSEPSRQIEIQLGHLCNNRCVFCVSGQLSERHMASPLPQEPIRAELRAARENGATRVTFVGGEPTLQPSFLDLLRFSVELDFEEIVLFTNGTMTPRASFRERTYAILKALGPEMARRVIWRFSLQGGTREAHDLTTGNPGAWDRIQTSLAVLRAEGARLTGNMCVVASNYASMLPLCDIAQKFGFENLHFDIVRPRDAGERTDEHLRAMMNRYSEMAPEFEALSREVDARLGPGFDLNFGNMPYCTALSVAHRIHHDGEATVTVAAEGDGTSRAGFDKYADKRTDKRKRPGCAGCVFDGTCSGVLDKYVQFHGEGEFVAVTPEALWQRDVAGHHFALLALPAVRTLAAAGQMRLVGSDERAGELHVTVGAATAPWRLTLRRAGREARQQPAQSWALLRAERFDAALFGSWPQRPEALTELRAALDQFAEQVGSAPVPDAALAALEPAWQRHAGGLQRARQGIAGLCDRLGRQTLAGLRPLGQSRSADGQAAELRFGDDSGSLVLAVAWENGSQIPRFRHTVQGLAEARIESFNRDLGKFLRALSVRPAP